MRYRVRLGRVEGILAGRRRRRGGIVTGGLVASGVNESFLVVIGAAAVLYGTPLSSPHSGKLLAESLGRAQPRSGGDDARRGRDGVLDRQAGRDSSAVSLALATRGRRSRGRRDGADPRLPRHHASLQQIVSGSRSIFADSQACRRTWETTWTWAAPLRSTPFRRSTSSAWETSRSSARSSSTSRYSSISRGPASSRSASTSRGRGRA